LFAKFEKFEHFFFFKVLISNLFLALIGGVVVNTCGYIRQEGYESFKHVAKAFDGKCF
jgi:hypothetical protein